MKADAPYIRLGDMPTECILTKKLDVSILCIVTNCMRLCLVRCGSGQEIGTKVNQLIAVD